MCSLRQRHLPQLHRLPRQPKSGSRDNSFSSNFSNSNNSFSNWEPGQYPQSFSNRFSKSRNSSLSWEADAVDEAAAAAPQAVASVDRLGPPDRRPMRASRRIPTPLPKRGRF
jgi:hypothetical protein